MSFLGIDIGGTKIKYALISDNMFLIKFCSAPTPRNYKDFIFTIKQIIAKFPNVESVGIGVPGVYDLINDLIIYTPNLGFLNGRKLKTDLAGCRCKSVFIENDANLAALGEYSLTEQDNIKNMLFITLGTGVGGGAIVNGRLFTGNITAFEAGHVTIDYNGRQCNCGRKGCLETYCSESGILKTFEETHAGKKTDMTTLMHLAKEKDTYAEKTFDLFSRHLATGIANYINLLAPEKVKIGGGLSHVHSFFLEKTDVYLRELVYPAYKNKFKLLPAELDNKAGVFGASALCKQKLKSF